ncbi:endonuclease NucS [Actinomycetaceae bacterium WB03_NA08]|uniref:Endonuclease NucS n=1 Tax=Scrofimicrobium canadense TaxID=2652290 RepID=A0A6N7VSJ3_9ACTO|nr:endonuclease NucS [Scrofimicrobium canadense]MSS84744.1 endonuclease NucS [Scrofimicrobium canadense]
MRLVIADCSVDYSGRLDAHLPRATRVLMLKADGSVLVHSDGGSYKPLNWMSPPCRVEVIEPDESDAGVQEVWQVIPLKSDGELRVRIYGIVADIEQDLGVDPGLTKDGVEAHLQELLAQQVPTILGTGWTLLRREHPTPIGPVDLLVYDPEGKPVAIEVKRRGGIDGVEQLTRYLELLGREERYREIRGIFAAQEIAKQARTLAEDRGIECLILDYQAMRGMDNAEDRLF